MIRNQRSTRGIAVRLLVVGIVLLLATTAGKWTHAIRGTATPVRDFAGRPAIWSIAHDFMVTGPKPRPLSAPRPDLGPWPAAAGDTGTDPGTAAASLRGIPMIVGGPPLWSTPSDGPPTSRAPPRSLLPQP